MAKATSKPPGPEKPVDARLVARISTDYLLRVLRLIAEAHEGELLTAIVAQAIIAANTAHLQRPADVDGADSGWLPDDSLRRPVSVLALSGSLGLPFETTRRHVKKLVDAGRCRRVRGGVIVPADVLKDADATRRSETNLAYVRRFVRALRDAGLTDD